MQPITPRERVNPVLRDECAEKLRPAAASNSELHSLLTQAFRTEHDAATLSVAIAALALFPDPALVSAADTRGIVARLRGLIAHPDAGVRVASLCALAAWDRSATIEDCLHHGLLDPALLVRQAAISAVGYSSSRCERLKLSLLEIARAPGEDASIRIRAAVLLSHDFFLSSIEHDHVTTVQLNIRASMANRARIGR